MQPEQSTTPRVTTLDGQTDFSDLGADDLVVSNGARHNSRSILLRAGMALDSEHRPISEAADGASMCLDGGTIIKLGGQIIAAEQAVADIDDRL